jgi:hypothetical protein
MAERDERVGAFEAEHVSDGCVVGVAVAPAIEVPVELVEIGNL